MLMDFFVKLYLEKYFVVDLILFHKLKLNCFKLNLLLVYNPCICMKQLKTITITHIYEFKLYLV